MSGDDFMMEARSYNLASDDDSSSKRGVNHSDLTVALADVTCTVEMITPETAEKWLKLHNYSNRPPEHNTVRRYAQAMTDGEWEFNGETIVFATTGRMLNGQHRCMASVMSGKAFPCLVVRNVPESAFKTLDQGKRRSAKDVLAIDGQGRPGVLAAAVRLVMLYEELVGGVTVNDLRTYSNSAILDYVNANPEVGDAVGELAQLIDVREKFMAPAPMVAFYCLAKAKGYSREFLNAFLEKLVEGTDLTKQHPILALRNRLIMIKSNRETLTGVMVLVLYVRAFNAYVAEDTLSHVVGTVKKDKVDGRVKASYPDITARAKAKIFNRPDTVQ